MRHTCSCLRFKQTPSSIALSRLGQADESKEIKVITICKALSSVHKSGTCTEDFAPQTVFPALDISS